LKKLAITFLLLFAVVLGGCGQSPAETANENNAASTAGEEEISADTPSAGNGASGKSLVVYFSMPETTEPDNMSREEELSTVVIDGEVLGNTQYVAYVIEEHTGADIFRIEPVDPYPMDHTELENIAQAEQRENARPEISGAIEDMEQYDTIFLGFPNWYFDMPMIIYSFLDQYDLSGKTVAPFVTSGGSGFSDAISTIQAMEPEANVITDGLSISRNTVADSETEIVEWLTEQGFLS